MTKGKLKIQSENILPIIKKWLYTDKEVFVRELVSNACDAINKVKILSDRKECTYVEEELKIEITVDPKKKTIQITDGGIGMTAEKVDAYIAQLAFSGAEEFIKKYENADRSEQIIGHFGLGFYSAFMASSKVEMDTLSFQENAKAAFWSCDGSSDYVLEEGNRKKRGTAITLHIAEDSAEFLEEHRLQSILMKHCRFLPIPILLNGKQINDKEALWIKSVSDCKEGDYLSFYRALYPIEADPIFWIHLNVDYPFHLKGILYFPKLHNRFEMQSHSVHLYCNRVFVSDTCKDLLPDYLTILRGIIDSPDIPLNVSRNNLQRDRTIHKLSNHIAKKVCDKLRSIYETNYKQFTQYWPDIELIVKLGILQDEKFYDKIASCLIWKSSTHDWTTIEEYLQRNKEKTAGKIFYCPEDSHTAAFLEMYKEQGLEILKTTSHLDIPLLSFLEGKNRDIKFQRLDGGVDEAILDASREKTLLDTEGKTEAGKMAEYICSHLEEKNVEVEAKSLKSDRVPAFLVLEEESRRLRDYLAVSGKEESSASFDEKRKFIINTNNPLVQAIYTLRSKDPALSKEMIRQLYELSLIEQKELKPEGITAFLKRSNSVLEKLSKYAITST